MKLKMHKQMTGQYRMHPLVIPVLVLSVTWVVTIAIINPVGEAMINDDWSFVRVLESWLWHGELAPTGWGKGGPAALIHILWGGLFTSIVGFSVTTLRVSVLVLGVLGSFSFLFLLRSCGVSAWVGLIGTLTLVLNPLFLSQCFTYMTDITFASLVIFSLFFLDRGEQQNRKGPIVIGLLLALGAMLTRQIGIVIPIAFIVTMCFHSAGRKMGRLLMSGLALILCILPWIGFEMLLYYAGSTPVTQHQVVANILEQPLKMGPGVIYYYTRTLVLALGYTALLTSPMLALQYGELWLLPRFRLLVYLIAVSLLVVEVALTAGFIDLPIKLGSNVIFNFGIGPILLKDTYILEIQRASSIPKTVYYAMAFWGLLACFVLVGFAFASLRQWIARIRTDQVITVRFVGMLSMNSALIYGTVITLSGSFDRYFIPIFIFVLIWWCSNILSRPKGPRCTWDTLPSLIPLVVMAVTSVLMVSDFMSLKRSLSLAHEYLLNEIQVNPCRVDGGFEFNGYHCYRKDYQPKTGLSWWWVDREDYLVTLGPLSGYEVVRTFPFQRYLGRDGGVFVLRPRSEKFVPDVPAGKRNKNSFDGDLMRSQPHYFASKNMHKETKVQ